MSQEELDILLKVVVAICLGGFIGIERELAGKPAGIRTHMFVAGAATLIMSISTILIGSFNEQFGKVQSDPVRVIEAITVGISFIGAGTVLKSEKNHNVYYLTTAASILFASGIGITVALEKYGLAISLAVLVVLVNAAVGGVEQKYLRKNRHESDNVHPEN
ncbi:MAG TPA: MgtC/SapB family protein [Candidatus Saccharibacteria bacterium]|jgi:putative Mg2+ transporter-C (MgtC) family protein|nr:MgtC/SapB family protein [Candidatus Saccharibacteria bacterium]HMT55652.1 MgtC/SapB family protein [Candidatus Saccharibacteria bacterium]